MAKKKSKGPPPVNPIQAAADLKRLEAEIANQQFAYRFFKRLTGIEASQFGNLPSHSLLLPVPPEIKLYLFQRHKINWTEQLSWSEICEILRDDLDRRYIVEESDGILTMRMFASIANVRGDKLKIRLEELETERGPLVPVIERPGGRGAAWYRWSDLAARFALTPDPKSLPQTWNAARFVLTANDQKQCDAKLQAYRKERAADKWGYKGRS